MDRENDVGFAMRKLSNLIKRDIENSSAKLGIEHVKGGGGRVLYYLYENKDKDIFQKDLENHFSVRRSTASVMLKTLEQKGLIERVSVDGDARLKKIVLTDKAYLIHEKIVNDIADREKRMRKGIPEEQLAVFFSVTEKMLRNLEDNND